MIAKLFIPHSFAVDTSDGFIVGIDYGAYQLASKGISMDLAIGDFDSVSPEQLSLIEEFSKEVIYLSVDKNEIDSEAAIIEVIKRGYQEVCLYGDIGQRLDHLLTNIKLVAKYSINYISDTNKIAYYGPGTHQIKKDYPVLSLIVLNDCELSLKNTLYELDHRKLSFNDNYTTSNAIIKDHAILTVHFGSVITIETKD